MGDTTPMRLAADSAATVSDPSGAFTVYKKDIRPLAIKLALLTVLGVSIASLASAGMAVMVAITGVVGFGAQLTIESREAIVLSSSTFEYRRGSNGTRALVRIADICRVEEISTYYWPLVKPVTVPGVKLVLRSGEEKVFPINFPARREILNRLRAMVVAIR